MIGLSKKKFYLAIFLIAVCSFKIESQDYQKKTDNLSLERFHKNNFKQWYTGPILTPTPITMPVSHPALESSFMVANRYGVYNNFWKNQTSFQNIWSLTGYWDYQMGFNSFLGAEIIAALSANFTNGASSVRFQDTLFRFGIQLLNNKIGQWTPDLRILFQETFPTGGYNKLDTSNLGTDATGQGSFQTGFHLVCQKIFSSPKPYGFVLRGSIGFFIPAPFNIKDKSIYGGTQGTSGKVTLGKNIIAYFSGQYAITQRFAVAFDSNYSQYMSGSFKGKTPTGFPVVVPQTVTFNLAPEIQHTLSEKSALIFGSWFTLIGQNTPSFVSIFASFLIAF